MQFWCLPWFLQLLHAQLYLELYICKALALDQDQNTYGWKKRERFASLLYVQDKDGQYIVGNSIFFCFMFF